MYLSFKGLNSYIEEHPLCHESATISQKTATLVIVGLFAGHTQTNDIANRLNYCVIFKVHT